MGIFEGAMGAFYHTPHDHKIYSKNIFFREGNFFFYYNIQVYTVCSLRKLGLDRLLFFFQYRNKKYRIIDFFLKNLKLSYHWTTVN